MAFPASLDTFPNPIATTTEDAAGFEHDIGHAGIGDAVEQLEIKVGINSSADATSLDYLLKNTTGGHFHDGVTSRKTRMDVATTKGDLAVYNGTTWIRVGVGADGTVLTASAAAGSGVAWGSPAAGNMATDALWDNIGDQAVGTGANTAAKVAKGTTNQVWITGASTLQWSAMTDAIHGVLGAGLHPIEAHGAAAHDDITQSFFIDLESWRVVGTSTNATLGSVPDQVQYYILPTGVDSGARMTFAIPPDWSSGMSVELFWIPSTTATANVRFNATYQSRAAGESLNTAGTTITSWTAAVGTIHLLQIEPPQTISTGVASGEFFRITVQRKGTDVLDTYAGDVRLVGVRFNYTAIQ